MFRKAITAVVTAVLVGGLGVTWAGPADAAQACMTRAEFRHVHMGMTLPRVARIVGSRGHVFSVTESGDHRYVIREWPVCGSDSAAAFGFANGHVRSRMWA